MGGTQRLARAVGKSRAMEMILTGARISAAEAVKIGLASRAVPADELMGEARKASERLLQLLGWGGWGGRLLHLVAPTASASSAAMWAKLPPAVCLLPLHLTQLDRDKPLHMATSCPPTQSP